MKVDRVVITTFPGYFFSTVLCLNSIRQHAFGLPVDIIIDDFDLTHWPSYVEDVQQHLSQHWHANLTFYKFSQIPNIDSACAGGWFRQQFVKMYLDQIVTGNHWLLVDADVIFKEEPDLDRIPLVNGGARPIDIGNRRYVEYFLQTDQPYLEDPSIYWCASSRPFRYISRDLLVGLRNRVELKHKRNFLEMHTTMVKNQELVAYDDSAEKMVMSEFQLIEVYRHRYKQPLPFVYHGTSKFFHDSIKDWRKDAQWFEQQGLTVESQYWNNLINFGKHAI